MEASEAHVPSSTSESTGRADEDSTSAKTLPSLWMTPSTEQRAESVSATTPPAADEPFQPLERRVGGSEVGQLSPTALSANANGNHNHANGSSPPHFRDPFQSVQPTTRQTSVLPALPRSHSADIVSSEEVTAEAECGGIAAPPDLLAPSEVASVSLPQVGGGFGETERTHRARRVQELLRSYLPLLQDDDQKVSSASPITLAECPEEGSSGESFTWRPLDRRVGVWEVAGLEDEAETSAAPFMVEPVHVRASTVEVMLERLVEDHKAAAAAAVAGEKLQSAKKAKSVASSISPLQSASLSALPAKLDMPLNLRCDFCRQYDSMCSRCHLKWRHLREQRVRAVGQPMCYGSIPLRARRALFFLMAARGTGELTQLQCSYEKSAVWSWSQPFHCVPFSPSAMAQEELPSTVLSVLQEAFDVAGRVHALHVAIGYRNANVLRSLLQGPPPPSSLTPASSSSSSSVYWVMSERGVDPLAFLLPAKQPPTTASPTVEALEESVECYVHLLYEATVNRLRARELAEAETLCVELLQQYPRDERGLSCLAEILYRTGRYIQCCELCQRAPQLAALRYWPRAAIDAAKAAASAKASSRAQEMQEAVRTPFAHDGSSEKTVRHHTGLRRLPFRLLTQSVLPFCSAEGLLQLFQCSRIPLLRRAVEEAALKLPAVLWTPVVRQTADYAELMQNVCNDAQGRCSFPSHALPPSPPQQRSQMCHESTAEAASAPPLFSEREESASLGGKTAVNCGGVPLVGPPVHPMSLTVRRMIDLTAFEVRVAVIGLAPPRGSAAVKPATTGARSSTSARAADCGGLAKDVAVEASDESTRARSSVAQELVVSRSFRISRPTVSAAWNEMYALTEWSVDEVATQQLRRYLAENAKQS